MLPPRKEAVFPHNCALDRLNDLFVCPLNILTHKRHHMTRSCRLIIAQAERNIPARVKEAGSRRANRTRTSLAECVHFKAAAFQRAFQRLFGRDAVRLCMQGGSEFVILAELLLSFGLRWTFTLHLAWRHVSADLHVALLYFSVFQCLFLPTSSCSFPWTCHGHGPPSSPVLPSLTYIHPHTIGCRLFSVLAASERHCHQCHHSSSNK